MERDNPAVLHTTSTDPSGIGSLRDRAIGRKSKSRKYSKFPA